MPRGGGRDDRRSRYGGGPRDDYDRNDRRRDRDRGGDNRDNRDDRRRYRSRSRDRRDRDPRPRSRDRQRDDHEHDRDRDAAAGRDRDRDRRDRDGRRGGHGPDDGRRKRDDGDLDRPSRRRDDDAPPRDRRRSASPRQGTTSPPPRARRPDSRHAETLPTRSKGAGASASDKPKKDQHPMSFKMGGSGRNGSPAVAGDEDRGRQDSRTPMEEERRREARDDDDEEDEDLEVEVEDGGMAAMMGFGGFGTTKGKKIAGNNAGGVHKEKTSEYRQYMNRQGGFNRPLSPSR